MATVGHLIVGLAVGRAYDRGKVAMGAMSVGAVLPDLDFLLFPGHGILPYAHRGMTHSLAFAVLAGLAAWAVALVRSADSFRAGLFFALTMATHGVIDAFSLSGSGIDLLWPILNVRLLPAHRFIPVASFASFGVFVVTGFIEVLVFSPFALYALWPRREAAPR